MDMKRHERDWLDVEDVAKEWNISKSTVYKWIRDRKVDVTLRESYRCGVYLIAVDSIKAKPR
jgi:transposase